MKHLKKFEAFEEEKFDLGNYPVEDQEEREEECKPCEDEEEFAGGEWEDEAGSWEDEEHEEHEQEEEEERRRLWGDEATVERISSFNSFVKEAKKAKPDFLDLDKDGDKKESMKKAAKDAKDSKNTKKDDKKEDKKDNKKEEEKEEKGGKGLTAAQKKLPEGLRKAIEARKKK
jgi:hypothetical protein